MENKILEEGTLVYSKEYGQGIVLTKASKTMKSLYEILWERTPRLINFANRKDLFVKGDKVSSRLRDIHFIYKGYAPFLNQPFAVEDNNEMLHYLNEIYHVEEDTIEITVKVNGREVPLNTLSMDTLEKLRAMETL